VYKLKKADICLSAFFFDDSHLKIGGWMNRKMASMLLLLVSFILFAGCAGLMERHDEARPVYIGDVYNGGYRDMPKSLIRGDEVMTLYLNREQRVIFKRGDDKVPLDEDIGHKGSARAVSLREEDGRIYAVWWKKTSQEGAPKYLYFRASHDGGKTFAPTRVINSGGGALNYSLATDSKGTIVFVYDDERRRSYEVYLNISYDYGRTWLDDDIRLDSIPRDASERGVFAIEPKAIINGEGIVVTWKEKRGASYFLKSRTSHDGAKTWSEEVVIREAGTIFSSDNLILHNNMPYIIGQENGTGISGFRSIDNGMTWEGIGAIPGTEATVNSQIKVISNGDTLYAVWTSEAEKRKSQVWFSTYLPTDNRWNKTVRLDRKKYDLTMAISPDISLLKDGAIAAVWEDYRDIRPNIYMNTSHDNGETWQDSDSPIGIRGRYSSIFPQALSRDDSLFVFFHRYRGDTRGEVDYLYERLRTEQGISFEGREAGRQLSDSEKEKRLWERVNSFWRLRINREFADTYDYHDPLFRNTQRKDMFAITQGNITYNKFEIAEIEIKDNIAKVKIKYNFEVKDMEAMGIKIVQKPTDDVLSEDWVWLYDNWYKVFKKPIGGQSLLNY